MRVKRILTVLFVMALLLTGCAPDKSGGHSLHLFYPAEMCFALRRWIGRNRRAPTRRTR